MSTWADAPPGFGWERLDHEDLGKLILVGPRGRKLAQIEAVYYINGPGGNPWIDRYRIRYLETNHIRCPKVSDVRFISPLEALAAQG